MKLLKKLLLRVPLMMETYSSLELSIPTLVKQLGGCYEFRTGCLETMDVEIFDPVTRSYSLILPLKSLRTNARSFLQPDGSILLIGGNSEHRTETYSLTN